MSAAGRCGKQTVHLPCHAEKQQSSKPTISLDACVSNDKKQDLRQSAFTSKQDVKDHICGNLIIFIDVKYLKVHKILTTCLALKR